MRFRHLAAYGLTAWLCASAGGAQATTTFYTRSADFLAHVPGFATLSETYEGYPLGQVVGNDDTLGWLTYAFSGGAIGRIGDRQARFDAQSLESTDAGGQFAAGDSLSVTAPWHLHWFGAFIHAAPLATDSVCLSAFGGQGCTGASGYDVGEFYFIGATTDEHTFDTVTFGTTSDGTPFNVDNLLFNIDPLPEPADWILLVAGLGAAGAALRGRRPSQANI